MTDDLRVLIHSRCAAVLAGIELTLGDRTAGGARLHLVAVSRLPEPDRCGRNPDADVLVAHGLDPRDLARWPRPALRAVVLAVGDDWCGAYVLRSLRSGVRGVVSIDSDLPSLAEACRRVAGGSAYLSPSMAGALAAHLAGEDTAADGSVLGLAAREVQVLRYLAVGRSQTDISGLMNITLRTVKHHLGNVYRKLGVHTQHEAVILAYREGLVV